MSSRVFADRLLDGQVVLVTGGGTGLGLAAVTELLACGASVVIAGRRAEVLEEACAELGERCTAFVGDIRDADSAAAIVDAVLERHGKLDTLINNAGGQYFVPAEAIAVKGWQAVTRLNIGGTLTMTQAAYERALKPGGGGMVINVTLSPHNGLTGMAHSSAARAAVEGVTRELAREWRDYGVAVTAAAVGHFDTPSLRKYPEPVWSGAARTPPLQRLGRMEEHAWLIAMLSSPLGRSFSGSVLTLDGARDNWFGPWPPAGLIDEAGDVPTEERRPRPSG